MKQMHNKREAKIKDPLKAELRKSDMLNSSLMSYEQIDQPSIEKNRRPTTRNLTAIRKQNIHLQDDPNQELVIMHGNFKLFIL